MKCVAPNVVGVVAYVSLTHPLLHCGGLFGTLLRLWH